MKLPRGIKSRLNQIEKLKSELETLIPAYVFDEDTSTQRALLNIEGAILLLQRKVKDYENT